MTPTARGQFSVSVAGAAIGDLGRCLIIRRTDNGHWEPPGGILKPGETIPPTPAPGETGLDVGPVVMTGAYHNALDYSGYPAVRSHDGEHLL